MTTFKARDLIIVEFPSQTPQGHEQEGRRPAVILGVPTKNRYPTVIIAPFTRDTGQAWALKNPSLYPRLASDTGGLPLASIVMLDQIKAADVTRISRKLGRLTADEYTPILNGVLDLLEVVRDASS